MKNHPTTAGLVFLVLMTVFSCRHKETWAGSIETKDGVTVVRNPNDPIYWENGVLPEKELTSGKVWIEPG